MLVTLNEILKDAKEKRYGVGMFNSFSIELARGVLEAAEQSHSPVIMGTAEGLLPACDLEMVASFLVPMAKKASVPIALHFDHGMTAALLKKAVEVGFTSVMYDCSQKPFAENAALCEEMAAYVHKQGVSIEAELGHVAFKEGGGSENMGYTYTEPEEVEEFVEKTGVDALAVAIGTEHGVYVEKPKLDINRLAEIREKSAAYLVLHGGSGLSDEDFKNCIANGIHKINIYTDISQAASWAARDYVQNKKPVIEAVSVAMKDAVRDVALRYLDIFDSAGKA